MTLGKKLKRIFFLLKKHGTDLSHKKSGETGDSRAALSAFTHSLTLSSIALYICSIKVTVAGLQVATTWLNSTTSSLYQHSFFAPLNPNPLAVFGFNESSGRMARPNRFWFMLIPILKCYKRKKNLLLKKTAKE